MTTKSLTCPHCGESFIPTTTPRAPKAVGSFDLAAVPAPLDTLSMSPSDAASYFKRTAPMYDVAFILGFYPELAATVPATPSRDDARRLFNRARALSVECAPFRNDWLSR
jgi:hypothetical protein